jgi:transposase-like protein
MKNSEQLHAEKQLMLDDWQTSGQSIVSYCKEHDIAYHSFFYWQKKLSSSGSSQKKKFLKLTPSSSSPILLTEIIYPNGKRIVFHSPVEVSILKQLAE